MSRARAKLSLDFVVYPGDPDEGAEPIPSAQAIEDFEKYREHLSPGPGSDTYGAVVIKKDGKAVGQVQPDPIRRLITNIVRTVPYVMDGEPETVLLSESLHGYLFETANDDVLVSFFKGDDAFEPEEYLIEQEPIDAAEWSEQVLGMGDRLLEILKLANPEGYKEDEFGESLLEFMEVGKEASKNFRLERERGLRR